MLKDFFAQQISLRPAEKIITIIHHHPITYLKQILITAFLILLAFFLMFFLISLGPVGVAFFVALLLTGLIYGAREFFLWYANAFIISNQRIIDIDRNGIFQKIVSEAPFANILDISYSVKGFRQTVFNIGTVRIKATGLNLVLANIHEVVKINQLISDLIRQQTGKNVVAQEITEITSTQKAKLTENFLKQDSLNQYEEYDLSALVEEYQKIYGELKLKKILVDELSNYYEKEEVTAKEKLASFAPESSDSEVEENEKDEEEENEEDEEEENEEEVPKFAKKKL